MSLLSTLGSSSSVLTVFERAMDVTQNNVANASTPDFASQNLDLASMPFDPAHGLKGGVEAGQLESTRSEFADAAVRLQEQSLGSAQQKVSSLTTIQTALNLSGSDGIPASLSALFQAFSAWSAAPSDSASRQAVLNSAQQLADSFHSVMASVNQAAGDTATQIAQTVDQINTLGANLHTYNLERMSGDRQDPGLDAKIHATLDSLSALVNFTSKIEPDGSVTVLLGGQTPLVIGDHAYQISSQVAPPANLPPGTPPTPPTAVILDSAGRDITTQMTGGALGALVDTHNRVLAGLRGDSTQPGLLNQMAQAIADRVNQLLAAGNISDGPPPVPGVALFSYDTTNATNVASSLALAPGMTPDQLAAIDPGPPEVGNGTALKLANLQDSENPADQITGLNYSQFYGNLAAAVGRELSTAQDQHDVQQQLVAQAQAFQQQTSGVSLDAEAVKMLQFQRAYEANAKFITVLDALTETAVNIIPA